MGFLFLSESVLFNSFTPMHTLVTPMQITARKQNKFSILNMAGTPRPLLLLLQLWGQRVSRKYLGEGSTSVSQSSSGYSSSNSFPLHLHQSAWPVQLQSLPATSEAPKARLFDLSPCLSSPWRPRALPPPGAPRRQKPRSFRRQWLRESGQPDQRTCSGMSNQ